MKKTTYVEILTIGDELLYGQIVDTNSQWISETLDKAGYRVIRKTTVSDNRDEILSAFTEAEARADVVLITGGLGPTSDDLTKPCLAAHFNCPLEMNEVALEEVRSFFQSKGMELSDLNSRQAELPVCCDHISNHVGTAPGMWFSRENKVFVSMPGVPHEMKRMMTETVIPRLQKVFDTRIVLHRLIKTIGIGESWLSEMIGDWEQELPSNIRLAYLPSLGQVKLRLTATGDDKHQLEKEVNEEIQKVKPLIETYIYGYDGDEIQGVIGRELLKNELTLSTAESCTGGYVAHLITSIAGSSGYFQGGVVAYDNHVKESVLGVSPDTLLEFGAVSEQTAREMASGVRKVLQTDIGVATTGIAGPDGGTPEKPVGTVWIACDLQGTVVTRKLQLWKDRQVNIHASAIAVLNMIRISLSKSIAVNR